MKQRHPDLRIIPRTTPQRVAEMLDAGTQSSVVSFPDEAAMREFARIRISNHAYRPPLQRASRPSKARTRGGTSARALQRYLMASWLARPAVQLAGNGDAPLELIRVSTVDGSPSTRPGPTSEISGGLPAEERWVEVSRGSRRDDGDVRGDAVILEVDGVDAPVVVRVGDDWRGVVVVPSLFLSAATATRSTELTFLPKFGAPTIQMSQISFVFWFVKPVRSKRFARFFAFLAPTVVVERSTIRPGTFSSTPGAKEPGKGAWFWCAVGPVSWKSAPLATRLGSRRARSTKKPLLCFPACSKSRAPDQYGSPTYPPHARSALSTIPFDGAWG